MPRRDDLGSATLERAHEGARVAVRKTWEPHVDILDERECLVVRAELPGVGHADVEVTYHAARGVLSIAGTRTERDEDVSERIGVYGMEVLYGDFAREVRLPDVPVTPEGVRARFRDGMMYVVLPKRPPEPGSAEGRPPRATIAIVTP